MSEYVVKYSHPTGDGTVKVLLPSKERAVIVVWLYINENMGNDWADAVRFVSVNGEEY